MIMVSLREGDASWPYTSLGNVGGVLWEEIAELWTATDPYLRTLNRKALSHSMVSWGRELHGSCLVS